MLALFPLSIVLFPESVFRLHIFETRYKNLVNDCIENDTHFGINPIIAGKIMETGCTAKVIEVLKRYPNGKMDIFVRGIKRYTLKVTSISPREYMLADVDLIDEDFIYPDAGLLEECILLFNKIAKEVKSLGLKKVDATMFYTVTPSYFFAEKSGMSIKQKYHLLNLNSEQKRLEYLREHLRDVEPMLRQSETIHQLIKNDGYAKRF